MNFDTNPEDNTFVIDVINEFYDIITDKNMLMRLNLQPDIYEEHPIFDQCIINKIEVYEQDIEILEANRELFGISPDTYIISY